MGKLSPGLAKYMASKGKSGGKPKASKSSKKSPSGPSMARPAKKGVNSGPC